MPLFRGSKNATIVNGEIVATAQDIADAVNDAIAAKNAAEAAETGAQTAETNAETAETNAETAESNAETAESGAVDAQSYAEEWANKAEDSLVSGAAGGDGVDDYSALHHANKASDSASAASTSESNALTSEQNAQQAATDAETALDTFTDQYLGAKSSDPTTDNDGDPLQDGALYFNNTDGNLRIYSDSLSDWVVVEIRTDSEVRNLFSAGGDLVYNSSTGEFSVTTYKSSDFDTDFSGKTTTDLAEGTNLYYTDTRARNAVSASGDLSYDASTGVFSFTETPNYTDSDVDTHLSGGTGVTYSSGEISIGQDVGTSASVTFLDAEFTGTGAIKLPSGTNAQRPATPNVGDLRHNTEIDSLETYNGTAWQTVGDQSSVVTVNSLVIAGGGGGASGVGGGGAGGYRSSVFGEQSGGGGSAEPSLSLSTNTSYTITIGAGGAEATKGSNSVFSTITSVGGGRGGKVSTHPGGSGGSGGGGSGFNNLSSGDGTSDQGTDGGEGFEGTATGYAGGGGGGAGAKGSDGTSSGGGAGGAGITSSITGFSVGRAGGGSGRGAGDVPTGGGATDGGGDVDNPGAANKGGGGGSGTSPSGGSGVVILRYPNNFNITNPGGGLTFSTTSLGNFKITTFTAGTGNIQFDA